MIVGAGTMGSRLVGYHIQDFCLKLLIGTSSGFGPLVSIVDQSNQYLENQPIPSQI